MKWVAALFALALLTYFQFPGHTYLTQDSQIYVPILEHLWDPAALQNDILVQRPHVAFTLYDEICIALRWLTHSNFHFVLAAQQIVYRSLYFGGVYLIALAILRDRLTSFFATALFALGAEVAGPAVLVIEYEPTPRAFAIPLLFLGIGWILQGRPLLAGSAASLSFLLHPPSVWPFWLIMLFTRKWRAFLPLCIAIPLLALAAHWQPGITEPQLFFARIGPALETLQRLRGAYNWVGTWWWHEAPQYLVLAALTGTAAWRLKLQKEFRPYLLGLPLLGLVSVPISYLLLDLAKWAVLPQIQPARALLFVVAATALLAAIAGYRAATRLEAFAWFVIAYLLPQHARVDTPPRFDRLAVALSLAAATAYFPRLPMPFVAYFALPLLAHNVNYPRIANPDLIQLSAWAASATPKDSVFAFPHPAKSLEPGVFRSIALRAVYADWKGGGQVNYLKDLADDWWQRYQNLNNLPATPEAYSPLGVDYIVLPQTQPLAQAAVFTNPRYLVYPTRR